MTRDWRRSLIAFSVFLTASAVFADAQQPADDFQPPPQTFSLGAWLRPIKTDDVTLYDEAKLIPQEKKDRVHFFMINGLDLAYAGNLNGLAAYFRSIGFVNTSCHHFPSTHKVRNQIEAVRSSDADARIILLGFSVGANHARRVANELQQEGVFIDCLIYLGGDMIFNTGYSTPNNVGEIVNITGHGLIFSGRDLYFKGDTLDGAANYHLDARHITIPAQPEVIHIIGPRLLKLASLDPTTSKP